MKLSIVMTTRNDMYDGDQLYRNQTSIETLLALAGIYQLDAELIIVEWNPPADKPRLKDAIQWPETCPIPIRIIEVPPDVHKQIEGDTGIPFFQMWAKNVGIRRARGESVLCTNSDLIFSRELMAFLARGSLDPECYYRVDRHDVTQRRISGETLNEKLRYCADHVGHVCRGRKRPDGSVRPHSNACGDFTLMHRDKWFELRAYLELPLWSIFIDGILLHTAFALGIKQVCLDHPMYHIHHDMAWSVTEEMADCYPSYPSREYREVAGRTLTEQRAIEVNPGNNWGLVGHALPETYLKLRRKPAPVLLVANEPQVTIFSTTKLFRGGTGIGQRNAIQSWQQLSPRPEIILVGEEALAVGAEMDVTVIPNVERDPATQVPLVNSVFEQAEQQAHADILVYVNADIILLPCFMRTLMEVARSYEQFLMVGQRHDLRVDEAIDFDSDWEAELRHAIETKGVLHSPCGIDYFAYRRGLWAEGIPPFAIGYTAWDNWKLWWARQQGVPVIDATQRVTIVHQQHSGDRRALEQTPTCKRNRELAGPAARSTAGCIHEAATIRLEKQ